MPAQAQRECSIAIIGGGIIGCTIARELAITGHSGIVVIEKNETIPGLNQSSTNEGSIHSGLYYPKDIMPLKAELCVRGNALMYEFLENNSIPHQKVGKLVVATTQAEEEYLRFFMKIGRENGVPELAIISGKEAIEREPNLANVRSALYAPSTGCVSPEAMLKKVKEQAEVNGVTFMLDTAVIDITPEEDNCTLALRQREHTITLKAETTINAAGLFADEVARMINPNFPHLIEPMRGEFFYFDKSSRKEIWMNGKHVYQPPYCYTTKSGRLCVVNVPVSKLKQKLRAGEVTITAGVHLSPAYDYENGTYKLNNRVTVSPLKTAGLGKTNYTANLHSAEDYIQKVHRFFPNLKPEDLSSDHTGIMATLKGHRDFVIERDTLYPNCINLVGMESPAWTSCFAVAEHVRNLLS